VLRRTLIVIFLLLGGCARSSAPAGDAGVPDGELRYLPRLASGEDFARLQGEEGEVKFLAPVAGTRGLPPLAGDCLFQNTARYPGHIGFLKSFPELQNLDFEAYLGLVMKSATRVLWGGELKLFSGAVHPRTGGRGVLAYFVYADDTEVDALTPAQLAEVDARIKGCVPYARDLLVLAGQDLAQHQRFAAQAAELKGRGIDVLDPRLLRPGGAAEGYSLGEGYGFLAVIPAGQRPDGDGIGPRDVVVTESAVEDLSLVAGLVTAFPQNLHSHVNLRLREKGIPNARLPDVYQNQVVSLLDGKLVHLVVEATAVRIEPALPATAEAFWASHRPVAGPLRADLAEGRLRPLGELRVADALAFGSKAANLGELGQALPAANRVTAGFAIPFSTYRDFMEQAGLQPLLAFLSDPRTGSDARFRRGSLATLRKAIEASPFPPALLARLQEAARAAFGEGYLPLPVRFRSSSNVEDGELVSGAGLHESARGCFADDADGDELGPSLCLADDERVALAAERDRRIAESAAHPDRSWLAAIIDDLDKDLTRERSVARAVKKVYASLWNDRAFEERAYFSIDHRAAFMGIAVEPSFVLEKRDAVAVTNLEAGAGGPLYRLVSQRDGQGVVRPADPTVVPETLTFRRGPGDRATDLRVITPSSLSAEPLWSAVQLDHLAALLFAAHDHFTAVYPPLPRRSFDLEIKLTHDDRIVFKQIRPYLGAAE
jgi:pyruvate,water dikinase